MPLSANAPAFARELALAYESGAFGQFVLYGNVADRFPLEGRLVNLGRFLDRQLLSSFATVFVYDAGNGLSVTRSAEAFQKWPGSNQLGAATREPRGAIEFVARYLRYRGNLAAMGRESCEPVAFLLRGADHVLPANRQGDFEVAGVVSLIRDFAAESPFTELPFVCLLVADNLNDLHPQIATHPRVARIRVPLPDRDLIAEALAQLQVDHPAAFVDHDPAAADILSGVSISTLQALVRTRAHERQPLTAADWLAAKKRMIETDAAGLVEFVESKRSLDDYHAQDALKQWLRDDMKLWRAGDLRAMPMGYLFCGPVGTGKTYLVECLAGEAATPVVKLKNFRDRWVGSSEGNLEKIFRLLRALGRCIVFIDEADQSLGRRDSGSGDSGLSGRLYSMIAQEMSDGSNRGRLLWILASSRPDLIEVDLKRPGRIDVKVPLLPTTSAAESAALINALLKRFDIAPGAAAIEALDPPRLLTPGAAETLATKVYRRVRTSQSTPIDALRDSLDGYQPPVRPEILEFQMRLAIREASDMAFVPPLLRPLAEGGE